MIHDESITMTVALMISLSGVIVALASLLIMRARTAGEESARPWHFLPGVGWVLHILENWSWGRDKWATISLAFGALLFIGGMCLLNHP